MEQSPSWEAYNHLASQEIPCLLWNPKVHFHALKACHWSLSWFRCIQSTPSHLTFLKNHYNIILPSMPRSCEWSVQVFQPKYNMHFSCLIHAMFPVQLILLDLITLIIFGEYDYVLSSKFRTEPEYKDS
jgi:hypothetical protein